MSAGSQTRSARLQYPRLCPGRNLKFVFNVKGSLNGKGSKDFPCREVIMCQSGIRYLPHFWLKCWGWKLQPSPEGWCGLYIGHRNCWAVQKFNLGLLLNTEKDWTYTTRLFTEIKGCTKSQLIVGAPARVWYEAHHNLMTIFPSTSEGFESGPSACQLGPCRVWRVGEIKYLTYWQWTLPAKRNMQLRACWLIRYQRGSGTVGNMHILQEPDVAAG